MTKFASQFGVPGNIWYTGKVVSYVNRMTYNYLLTFTCISKDIKPSIARKFSFKI